MTATQIAQIRQQVELGMGTLVSIETYSGSGSVGPVYAASVDRYCGVAWTRQLVRGPDGSEEVSEFTITAAAADEALFEPESRITVAGRPSTVITANAVNFGGQVTHVEVACR
jgi:hypothetical protein